MLDEDVHWPPRTVSPNYTALNTVECTGRFISVRQAVPNTRTLFSMIQKDEPSLLKNITDAPVIYRRLGMCLFVYHNR
jgi:hypothetical protein